jgi:hypothetical protein
VTDTTTTRETTAAAIERLGRERVLVPDLFGLREHKEAAE